MTAFLFILSGVIIPIALGEVGDWLPRLSERLLSRAAARLGSDALADRYAEEWAAELNEIPGKYSKLGYALGRLTHMRVILREVRIDRERLRTIPQQPAPELDSDTLEPLEPLEDPTAWVDLRPQKLRIIGHDGVEELHDVDYGGLRDFDYGDQSVGIVVSDAYWAQVENQDGFDDNTIRFTDN